MKRKLTLLLTACLLTTGCGATNQPVSEQSEAAQSTTTMEAKEETTETEATTTVEETTAESTTTIAAEPEYTDNDVNDAYNWLIGDVWNKGLHDVRDVLNGSKMEEFDVDFCIENLKIAYAKKEQYNEIIHALDSDITEQAQLILAWDKSIEQTDLLMSALENGVPDASSFDTELLSQYSRKFYDLYMDKAVSYSSVDSGKQKFVFVKSD